MRDNLDINPEKKWVFGKEVAGCFDDMLARSIPNYQLMRETTNRLGSYFVRPFKHVVDLGCSRGLSSDYFIENFPTTKFLLIDNSEDMARASREKYALLENVRVENADISDTYIPGDVCLMLSILTLQFIDVDKRQKVLDRAYRSLEDGGAFVLVEKLDAGRFDDIFVREYYRIKARNGYTPSQIINKRESLRGVLRPLMEQENLSMLEKAGFKTVECFFRCLNFAGYIAVKDHED